MEAMNKWVEEWYFLVEHGVYHAYLHIWELARSTTELEKLIHFLPKNAQLLPEDIRRFKGLWERLHSTLPKDHGGKPRDYAYTRWFLKEQLFGRPDLCGTGDRLMFDLSGYYLEKLLINRERSRFADMQGNEVCKYRVEAILCEQKCRVHLMEYAGQLGVKFEIYCLSLDEPFTRGMLSTKLKQRFKRGDDSTWFTMWYEIDANSVIEVQEGTPWKYGLRAKNPADLELQLRNLGLDVRLKSRPMVPTTPGQ